MSEILLMPFIIFVAIKLMGWINRQVGIDPKLEDPRDYHIQIKRLKFQLREANDYGPTIEVPPVVTYHIPPQRFHMQFAIHDRELEERGPEWVDRKVQMLKEDFLRNDEIKPFIKHECKKSDHSYETIHRLTLWITEIPDVL